MFKKILSAALAMAMVLSMTVAGSAASLTLSGKKSSTTSDKTTSSTTTTTTTTTTTSSDEAYDFCQTQLKNDKLALAMHNAFVNGLRSYKNKITISVKGYTYDQIEAAFKLSFQMILDEHPELFWLDTMQNIAVSADLSTITFYPRPAAGYGTASKDGLSASTINTTAIKNTTAKMNNAVAKMTGSGYELIKNIHDTIISNTKYPANPENATHNQHQAVGPLVEGRAVCDGYAKAFKYACDQKGIDCLIVVGQATNNVGDTGSHAWNYVKLNGKWYQVDTDWDDPQVKGDSTKSYLIYDYFMTGTVKNDSRRVDASMNYPTLSSTSYGK